MWERSFVAMTVAIGGTVDDAIAGLPARSRAAPEIADLTTKLRDGSRAGRANALAHAVHEIALAIDAVRLA